MSMYAKDPENAQPTAMGDLPQPKRSLKECYEILTAPGQMHELEDKVIAGRKYRVFKHAPASLRDFWMAMQAQFADRDYLVLDDERVTYKETHRRAVVLAELLAKDYGVRKGQKVAILMRNRPDWVIAFWAIHLLGAVSVAINAWLTPEGLVHCIKLSESVVVVVDDERAEILKKQDQALKQTKLKAILVSKAKPPSGMKSLDEEMKRHQNAKNVPQVKIEPEDDATIFFTSGTTSFPKAVLSTNRMFITNLFTSSIAARRAILREGGEIVAPQPSDPQKALLLPVPFFHVTGTQSLMMLMTIVGGKVVMMNKWSQREALRIIPKEGITLTGGVPFIVQETLEGAKGDELKTLEAFTFGGAPASDTLVHLFRRTKTTSVLAQAYGLTETNSVAVGHAGIDYLMRPLSTGLASFVNDIKIVDSHGKEVADGDIGEIWIRGPNVFKEYYNDRKATDAALDKDGWFRSGDLGSKDHEGFIYIRDRAKDIIIRGGENIAATTVENALYRNPKVQDCAVVAVSDKKLGELPAAVVVLRATAGKTTEDEIIQDTKKYLPKHAVPVMVILREPKDADSELRIERNPNGKIVKNELKKVVEKEWQRRLKAKL